MRLATLLLAAGCSSAPAPRAPVDAIHCTVRRDAAVGTFRVDLRMEARGTVAQSPSLSIFADQWGSVLVALQSARVTQPGLSPDGTEPALLTVTTTDEGSFVAVRCHERDDGRIGLELRAWDVRDGKIAWSLRRDEIVVEGARSTFRKP